MLEFICTLLIEISLLYSEVDNFSEVFDTAACTVQRVGKNTF